MSLPASLAKPIDVLLIDNFDSFTWNLYQSLALLGADVTVIRNDLITAEHLPRLQIRCLIISPGPGHPITDSGISRDAIKYFTGKVPVLGVCMGLECLVDAFGGEIAYAGEIKHGKLSRIRHDNRGCLKGAPQGFQSTRYHSLSANVKTLPDDLAITAVTEESGVIMGVRHRRYTLEAVQYHPESILSEAGDDLFRNFLNLKGGLWEENPEANVLNPTLPPFSIDVPDGQPGDVAAKIPSVLEKIYAQRLKDVEAAKNTLGATPADLNIVLSMHLAPPLVSVVERLKSKSPALMAEIKRASPSKQAIALGANAAQQAFAYALAGASVISVLTEPQWFKGSLFDMRLAREAVDSLPYRPAILRKDFILDEYQITEARVHGADTILLIVAMLPIARLKALYEYSVSLGMEPLVEVNNAREMEAALALGAKVIGVNNRNLHNFEVDMNTTTRLVDMVKDRDVILCALSGIQGREDVIRYSEQGVGALLVGEALMRASDPRAFAAELFAWPSEAISGQPQAPLVKICGIRSEEEAIAVATAGADMVGLMFVEKSKRHISLPEAQRISAAVRNWRHAQPSSVEPILTDGNGNEPWFTTHAKRLAQSPVRPLVVGVFQDHPLSFILHAIAVAQLDIVQLHGAEPVDWGKKIPVPVIRVFHVDKEGNGLEEITRPGLHHYVLLDAAAAVGQLSGGTGSKMDWEHARAVVDGGQVKGTATTPFPIILAGGLTPENVSDAIAAVKPWAVDVSGGVETSDGLQKDMEKVKAFIDAVKGQGDV